MHVKLVSPTTNDHKDATTDQLQGKGDAWREAHGRDDFGKKIKKLAIDVIEKNQWPRPQFINGIITDAISIVNAEVQRMKELQKNTNGDGHGDDDVLNVLQQAIEDAPRNVSMHASPVSIACTNTTITNQSNDDDDDILANIGSGSGGDDGDGDDDGNARTHVANGNGSESATDRKNSRRKSEFALVNLRDVQ